MYLLIFLLKVIFISGVVACNEEDEDCLKRSCTGKLCTKCLTCSLLFRKGTSCITDFKECGDCLEGYEEISVTDFSTAIKPCQPVINNAKFKECTSDNTCPPNNYCSKDTCVKCFDCALVNRLPGKEKCAKWLNECGSCRTGFHDVAITTDTNFRRCENSSSETLWQMAPPWNTSLSFTWYASLLVLFLLLFILLVIRLQKGRHLSKTISRLEIIPSAPPLHVMDLPECKERCDTYVPRCRETNPPVAVFENELKQQARIFKQPDALYYILGEEENDGIRGMGGLSLEGNSGTYRGSYNSSDSVQSEQSSWRRQLMAQTYMEPDTDTSDSAVPVSEIRVDPASTNSVPVSRLEAPHIGESAASETTDTFPVVKCRKCRHLLFLHPEITLFTAHGESYSNVSVKYVSCSTIQEDNLWFLQDNNLPQWISDLVNNSNWTKGKVNCPNCQGRLGSFDFVSGTQCQCGSHVLPPVHIVKCKVDCRNQG